MTCSGCGSTKASILHIVTTESGLLENCDICSSAKAGDANQPDVYLGSKGGIQTCENICDPKTGQPVPFSSKREKKAIMDRLKLRQADSAEKQHGYRNEKYLHKKIYG